MDIFCRSSSTHRLPDYNCRRARSSFCLVSFLSSASFLRWLTWFDPRLHLPLSPSTLSARLLSTSRYGLVSTADPPRAKPTITDAFTFFCPFFFFFVFSLFFDGACAACGRRLFSPRIHSSSLTSDLDTHRLLTIFWPICCRSRLLC